MTASDSARVGTAEQGLVIERIFDAPRELVWRAWTEPEHFMRWYGPKGMTLPTCEIDFRAAEGFAIAGLIGVILEISWFLGVGVGLWRYLPGEEAQPETAGHQ